MNVIAGFLHVVPGLTRDPAPRSHRAQVWIAGQAGNDMVTRREKA
jgi:hypothetical protein